MEAILGPDSEPFEIFLKDHKESSEEAKSMFKLMKEMDPDSLALKLVHYLDLSYDICTRLECAELLHKLFTDDNLWRNRLSVSTQSTIKPILLHLLPLEQSQVILLDLSRTISPLAVSLLPDNNWPELFPFLYQSLTHPTSNIYLKQRVFYIFSHLAAKIGETIVPCVKYLHSLFRNTLNDDTLDLNVRIAATTAVIEFLRCVPLSSNEKDKFQELLPGTLTTLTDTLSNRNIAGYVLCLFIELAKNDPKFFRMQLSDVVNSMLEIAEDAKLEDKTRHLAVEFVLCLVEARKKAPGMMRKLPLFTHTFFAILLNLLLDIKDEPSWHSHADNVHDDIGVTDNYRFGLQCLYRFSMALGGKTIVHVAMEQLGDYLVAPEWEKRHVALIALTQIAEGSSKVMIKYLKQIVKMVLHCFQDPHPRVRWAAINATLSLSIDLCPDFQEQYHNRVLPALAASMDDYQNPLLQAQTATAITCYCGTEKPETLVPYLDNILNKLLVILQNNNQMVKERALKALSAIVQLSKEHFLKYYDCVMPYLITILVNANDKYNHILRQYALECISLIVMGVGKGKFRDDLEQVMEVLIKSLQAQVKELDTIVYSLQACNRICFCMGKDFLPYMSTVMPRLIECAQLEPDKTVSSDELDESIHKVEFGNQIILARGEDVHEGKATACGLLCAFAVKLEEDFYPWISQAASVLVPLVKFYIHDKVRENASNAMSCLLRSAKLVVEKGTAQGGNMPYFKQLSGEIIHALGDALYSEPKTKICTVLLGDLNECLKICGPLLNEDQIRSIIDEIKHVLIDNSRRKTELAESAKSEDFDAEDAELMREEREQEAEVFRNVGGILLTLIKTFKAAFLPFLDELSSYLMPMRGEDKTAEERRTCIFIFDDIMEHCGEAAIKYHDIYLPFLLDSSNDEKPAVRQAALYGLVLCAEYGGYSFKPFIGEALSRIDVVITHFKALEPKNIWAYDNAVSALGKICQFHRESINSAQTIHAWLNCLPIKTDLDEAKVVHDQLCSMVKRSDKELLGPNCMHIPKVISVFAEVLCAGDDLATKETREDMINLLRHFHKTLPPATWASACSLLLPQQEMELDSILLPEEEMLTFQPVQ